MRSWIVVSCSVMCIGLSGAFEVVGCGGMGSGVVFSSAPMVGSVCESLDMCIEVRVGGRSEEGEWRARRYFRALLMCEQSLQFEL